MIAVLERLGFDTKAGIAATGGDADFYLELVRDFQHDYLARIAAIRHETDPTALARVAHDLKAVLRMLGETRIARMAEALETALRSDIRGAQDQAMLCDALEQISSGLAKSQ